LEQNTSISSPQLRLANLFLNGIQTDNPFLSKGRQVVSFAQTLSQVIENSAQIARQAEECYSRAADYAESIYDSTTSRSDDSESESTSRTRDHESGRPARRELKKKLEELGVPLNHLSVPKDSLNLIKNIMEDNGFSTKDIEQALSQLGDGPYSMDKVMAALSSADVTSRKSLKLSQETVPMLGKFLQELGLSAESVKNAMTNLKAGQKFSSEALRDILLKDGNMNLKLTDLSGVDQDNLRDMFKSMGMDDDNLKAIMSKLKQTNGRVSLESLLAGMKSSTSPNSLTAGQMENIRELMLNMTMDQDFTLDINFDKTLTMIQSMGDGEGNQKQASNSPAVEALRGTGQIADKVSAGDGVPGQSGSEQTKSSLFGQPGDNGADSHDAASGDAGSSKSAAAVSKGSETAPSKYISETVYRQIADKMASQLRNNQHRLQIQLTPPNLGKVDLDLVMKDNHVKANLVAENPVVKQVLEEQADRLRESLAQQGVELESFEISLSEDYSKQADAQQDESRGSSTRGSRVKKAGNESSEELQDIPIRTGDGSLVNLVA
jgi:flagellar hook-length control protein FliK